MRRSHLFMAAAVLLAGLAYLWVWAAADHAPGARPSAEGLMAPLDDAYIFGQYAAQAVRGEWLHYTPGAPVSTGVSSAAWLLALTGLMGLGWPLTWAAWALGLACLAWSVRSLLRLSRRLFPALPDWALPALFLMHASSVSLYFQGMDSGLLLAALLGSAEAALDPEASLRFWLLGGLLAFTRPEGQVAFPALALAHAWGQGRQKAWKNALFALFLAALPSLGLWAISGSPVPDSVRPKSAAMLRLPLIDRAEAAGLYAAQVSGQLLMGLVTPGESIGFVGNAGAGNDPSKHFPPLALAVALVGIYHACKRREQGPWWLALSAAWLATLLLLSWNLPVGWHRHRYLAPLWPLMILGVGAALNALQSRRGPWPRAGRSALLVLWLGFGLLTWPWFLQASYHSGANYAAANREAAYEQKALPNGGPVAVEDAGLIAYYGGRETVDLLGVTDHRLALLQEDGPGAVLQELQRRPAGQRPTTALLHPSRSSGYSALWTANGVLTPLQPLGSMVLYRFSALGVKK
jgi:hypothetical protein